MKLKDKKVLVTGASRGIGKAIALKFAENGADVVVNYCNSEEKAIKVVEEIKKLGRKAVAIKADFSNVDEVERLVDESIAVLGRIDVLVNNAGIIIRKGWEELDEGSWDKTMDINAKGLFFCSQIVGKHMMKNKSGRIINLGSIVGKIASVSSPVYGASKAAVHNLTILFAKVLAPYVNVNAIAPGITETDLYQSLPDEAKKRAIERTLLKRVAEPEEIADTALFLACDDSRDITKQIIYVDGGT